MMCMNMSCAVVYFHFLHHPSLHILGLECASVVHITRDQLNMNHYRITETQRKLFDACASGNKAEIFRLTSGGCDLVRLHNEIGQTPLHIACQHRQFDIVCLLVEVYGASPDISDNKGCTPLHEACLAGDLNTVAYMLRLCPKYNSQFPKPNVDIQGNTILHKACQSGNVAVVRYIVAHTDFMSSCSMCKLNLYQDNVTSYHKCICCNDGQRLSCNQLHPLQPGLYDTRGPQYCWYLNHCEDTPLHTACYKGHLNIIRYIIDEARPVVGFSIQLSSLMSIACLTGRADVIQYLLQMKSIPPKRYKCELDPEEVSSAKSIFDCDERMHKSRVVPCGSLLHTACKCGNVNLVRTLLKDCRCNSVTKDPNGDTLLHCACISDVVDIVDLLMTNFNELHTVQNSEGNTPLHIACEWGSINAARILITNLYCDLNVCNEDGETPLHLACKYDRLDICKLLLDNDHCDIAVQTSKTKETPLHIACCQTAPELVKCLLERCTSNQDIPDVYGDTPLFNACRSGNIHIVQQLLAGKYCNSLYVNARTLETPVHIACRMGRLDIVKVLLDGHQGQVNQQNQFGETVLHLACQADAVEIVNFLIQHDYCDPNIKSQSGESPLFIACKRNQISIVQCLHILTCNSDQTDTNRNTPLHIACSSNALDIVKLLVRHCSIDAKNSDGDTPLHIVCSLNHHDILKCLLEGQSRTLDHLKNNAGSTPLHCACSGSALNSVQLLIQKQYCDPAEIDLKGNSALHIACIVGNVGIAEYLITTGKCDLKKRNASRYPPLLCALEHANDELVKYIVERGYVNLDDPDHTLKSEEECMPLLHFAYCNMQQLDSTRQLDRYHLIRFLVTDHYCDINQQDSNGNTLLLFVCNGNRLLWDRELLSFLLDTDGCDLNCANSDGITPLHLACWYDSSTVETLLHSRRIKDVSPRNKNGKTPIQLTHDYSIIRLLIGYGANPQDVYEHYGQILEQCKKSQPLHLLMKVIVLGNSEAGKSTLVESLKTVAPDPTLIVSNVEGPTAGIVQIECDSEVFGKVLFHDFAGQPEFESSHSAFLESSLSPSPFSSPPIFILVVNVHNTQQKITQHLQYWLSFIKNYCMGSTEVKPHAIIIGSHADLLSPPELSASLSFLRKALDVSKQSVLKCCDPLVLDCREPGSVKMESLRTLLKESCSSLRICVELDSQCHVLFAYLHEQFTGVPAVTVGDLQRQICSDPQHTHTSQSISQGPKHIGIPLPFVGGELIKLLDVLHDQSHLLILKGAKEIKDYWIVLEQDTLLHKVNGTIFAPRDFEHHLAVETNTGVVPSSKLDKLFPDFDHNMVKQFLVYSEFCQEIEDDETLRLILGNGDKSVDDNDQSSSTTLKSESHFFFFPGLIIAKRPVDIWNQSNPSDYSYCCGWCVQCKPQQFLTSRFLQVLLLRLVFSYAAASSQDPDPTEIPTLKRICDVWKNGIHWCSRSGVEVLVEVTEQNTMVLLLMRCVKGQEMECVKLRSAVIRKILAAKEEFCSQVEIQEYFLKASGVSSYPTSVHKLPKVYMSEVVNTVNEAAQCILDHHGRMILLDELLYFEPFSKLGKKLITAIFDPENNDKEVSKETLKDISDLCHAALQQFIHMLQVPTSEVAFYHEEWRDHPSVLLLHVFGYWQGRRGNGGTYLELRKEFEKYSIFCERNLLISQHAQDCMTQAKGTLSVQ